MCADPTPRERPMCPFLRDTALQRHTPSVGSTHLLPAERVCDADKECVNSPKDSAAYESAGYSWASDSASAAVLRARCRCVSNPSARITRNSTAVEISCFRASSSNAISTTNPASRTSVR